MTRASSSAGHRANWLHTPAAGNVEVTLRLYGPRADALDGTYKLPPIARLN